MNWILVLIRHLIYQHFLYWFLWDPLPGEEEWRKSTQPVSVAQYHVHTRQHTHTHTHRGSAVALRMPWGTQERACDVESLVPLCSWGCNKSKLHELCCRCMDDVAVAPLIPSRFMGGRIPAWAWCGRGGGFLREQDQSRILARWIWNKLILKVSNY